MTTPDFNPYRAPEASLSASCDAEITVDQRPVPFEDKAAEPRFFPRVWGMFTLMVRDPKNLADRVPNTRSLTAPWLFMTLLSIPVLLLWVAIFGFLFVIGMLSAFDGAKAGNEPPVWLFVVIPAVFVLLLPFLQFMGMLVAGLVNHACLWMWGGLKQGLDLNATMRTSGYFFAFFTLVSWIPFIGSVAMLVGPAALGIGMARIHRTETWRGICAAYTPVLLCCCAYGLFFVIVMAVAAATGH